MRWSTILLFAAAFIPSACVTEQTSQKHNLQGIFDEKPTEVAVSMPKANDARLDITDPCLSNLTNIIGSLYIYYSKHNALPESLEQIPKLSPEGDAISFNCPGSGKPYIYFPQGFQAPKVQDLLILFDPAPIHRGSPRQNPDGSNAPPESLRYGIVMEPPRPNAPVKMFVIPLQQSLLDYYIQSPQPMRSQPFGQSKG